MGGVCPCLAGVDKAAGGGKASPAADKSSASSAPLKDGIIKPPPAAPSATKPADVPTTQPPKEPVTIIPTAPANTIPEPATMKPAEPPQPSKASEAPPRPPTDTIKTDAVPAEAPTEVAGGPGQEAPAEGSGGLDLGGCLEVWSNSYNTWCPGVIQAFDNTSVLMAYQVPGEPADSNISTKTLPLDSGEIRLPTDTGSWTTASVEVYSHSKTAWCLGKVQSIENGVLSVVFFYPGEAPDAVPVMKQLALGDKDLRLRGIEAALNPAGGIGHEYLQVDSLVEVYSNSLACWCPGTVTAIADGLVTIDFYYPDQDPSKESASTKQLPLGHQDLRLPGYETGVPYQTGPPVTEADIVVGAKLEVFSASRQAWLISEIKEIVDGQVSVLLRYPDMPPDSDLFQKELPIGSADMRLPLDETN